MRTQLWLLASVGLAWITSDADAALKVMSAPNLLRVGAVENIFVECQDCPGLGPTNVEISAWNHPTKRVQLQRTMVTLNSDNQYQALGQLVIPPDHFNKNPTAKPYVYLQATFPNYTLEKVVLVSFQPGYMFIQTDQPLYTPDSTVSFRIFALTPDMKPMRIDEATRNLAIITVEIETPEGIVIPLGSARLNEGMHSGQYRLGLTVRTGQWKVVARFQRNPHQTYSAEFEVKKYVLPSYEVKLISESPFFYYEAPSFTVRVKATYLFGGRVDGVAYVVFGVLGNDSRKVFPSSLQRISITGGNGEATLQKDQIPNIEELIGLSLFVTAMVYTESGSEMVEGELRNVPIVTAPYVIDFDKTPKYFRAGMPFDVTIIVTNPNGSPAEGVPVVLEPGLHLFDTTQANGMVSLTVNTMPTDTILTITARTNDNRLPPNRQTTKSMEARLYETKSQNYIQIKVMTKNVKLGADLKVMLQLNVQSRSFEITYLILSRGQLVHFGKQVSNGQVVIVLIIPVTKKMLPSFRMIAYYHATPTEVVSDSVWVDVDDSCMSTLKVEPKNPARSHESSSTFHLRVTAEPGATVGLGAVDKRLYALNNKDLLTQKKVWQTVEKADTGCTPGGGKNSMGVFFDAGLMFQTDTAAGTPYRQEHKCPPSTMKKQVLTFLAYNVQENSYKVNSPITTQTKFSDRWFWRFFKIPACAGNPDCDVNTNDMDIPLIDSISTWTFTGISLSENNGICVRKSLDVAVFKTFFIDLRLPYSAVVGQQTEIRAILHNSLDTPITVEVELVENAAVCSSAWRKGMYTQQVRVGPSTTHAVPFVIIPMKEGVLNIEVKATVKDSWQGDEVRKPLRVAPNGVLIIVNKVVDLAPKGGTQDETINSPITKIEMAPNTPSSTKVFVTGKAPITFQSVIGASSLGSLIYMPHGNGLSNIVHMNKLVTATISLDKTNQWEAVGLEKRSEALNYIKMGIQAQMNYTSPGAYFYEIQNRKSSTWLTAYVIKVFSKAESLVEISHDLFCYAVMYLIHGVQQADGTFAETGQIYPPTYTGDLFGRDSDASMTAFCLIAIQESKPICEARVSSLPHSIARSVAYLERRLPSLTNPYAVTITSYALANEHKLNKEILYNFVSPDKTHWAYPQNHMLSVEATAYALLALVKGNFLDEAWSIVEWFTNQQGQLQIHGSHAAVTMYQALSEYWNAAQEQDYKLEVELKVPDRGDPYIYHFNRDNFYVTRITKAFEVNENVTVTARGTGEATLTMETTYYALPKDTGDDCKFDLRLAFSLDRVDENDGDIYTLRVWFFFTNNKKDSSMSVLDIALPTGFILMSEDLDALSKGLSGLSSKFELNKAQSEKGSIVLYLDKVAHNRIEELAFRMRRTHKVDILQPAAVSLYEYCDESTKCVKYYHPQRRDGRFLRYCRGNECSCAENNCGMQKKGHIGQRDRIDKACESTQTSRTDFVYKVILEDVAHDLSFDVYSMRIATVIKDGTLDRTASGQLRKFLSSSDCRESLNLQTKKEYLIMGAAEDVIPDTSTQSFDYELSSHTWIESWPKGEQCQTEEHRPTCVGIEAFISMYEMFGCAA